MIDDRPCRLKNLHKVVILSSVSQSSDTFEPADFDYDSDHDGSRWLDKLNFGSSKIAKGLVLSWSTLSMAISRNVEHLTEILPIQKRVGKDNFHPSSRQARAWLLTQARAKQRKLELERQTRMASWTVAIGLAFIFLFMSSSQSSLPGFAALPISNDSAMSEMNKQQYVASMSDNPDQKLFRISVNNSNADDHAHSKEAHNGSSTVFSVEVNRSQKSELLMTRQPSVSVEVDSELPYSGTIFEFDDLFSNVSEKVLPRTAMIRADWPDQQQIVLATNYFHKPGLVERRDWTMLASSPAQKNHSKIPVHSDAPQQITLAYVPVQNMDEFKSPFAAVLNISDNNELQQSGGSSAELNQAMPAGVTHASLSGQISSDEAQKSLAPSGDVPVPVIRVTRPRLAPGDHSWAANRLPKSAFSRAQQRCLAAAIYFEARGESSKGQAAVAQVILNRVKNPAYPSTICGVVYQNKRWRNRCQFSFACDGIRDRIRNQQSYKQAVRIAKDVTSGKTWLESIGSSTHYHATYVNPRWAHKMKRMERIGTHIFYRTYRGGWS